MKEKQQLLEEMLMKNKQKRKDHVLEKVKQLM
jgi:hypothetical protein